MSGVVDDLVLPWCFPPYPGRCLMDWAGDLSPSSRRAPHQTVGASRNSIAATKYARQVKLDRLAMPFGYRHYGNLHTLLPGSYLAGVWLRASVSRFLRTEAQSKARADRRSGCAAVLCRASAYNPGVAPGPHWTHDHWPIGITDPMSRLPSPPFSTPLSATLQAFVYT